MRARLLPAAALFIVACGAGDTGSAGRVAEWQVDTTAVLQIGRLEGDSVYQLYRVRGIVKVPGGGIALANARSSEVRIFDAHGRYLRALGRAGEGPGEFTMARDLGLRGDTLLAYDRMAGRLTRFLVSGVYRGDEPVRASGTLMTPNFAGLLRDGTPVGWVEKLAGERLEGFQRSSAVLGRFTGAGKVDSLGSFPANETVVHRLHGGT